MFLSIGDDFIVRKKDVICVLDADTATKSAATRALWKKQQDDGLVVDCSGEIPLSLVLVKEEGKEAVLYLSRLSTRTIFTRASKRKGRNELD